jgi:hypothetical protein
MTPMRFNRRHWLRASAGALVLGACRSRTRAAADQRLRVAAVITEFTRRSHAHVILENFLEPYYFNGKLTDSGMDVAALYVDQFPEGRDMARDVARQYGIPIFPTIAETLMLGGNALAVDGVLSIGEHGNYPFNERRQHLYPRKRFFDEIAAVFRASGRAAPLFNDKHLSYRWDWAAEMVRTARELKAPFLAGSSVPLAQRRPALELPANSAIEEAVSIHSGGLESYDFHALEVLQSLVEARRGGETGVSEVQLLEGDDVWQAARDGRWSYALAEAAMNADVPRPVGRLEEFSEHAGDKPRPVHVILVKYRDGLKATVLRIGQSSTRWKFACRIAGQADPLATSFYVGPWENRNLFKALAHAIQTHVREKQAPYPIERTLLTTGILAAAMDSRFEQHRPLSTPHLNIAYQPRDFRAMREMGASWKIIPEGTPEPAGINPGGPRPSR